MSLRANKKKNSKYKPYDWTRLTHGTEIRNAFIVTVKNRFLSLQNFDAENTLSAGTRYTYFEKACKDAANKVIPLKPKLKKRIPWETEKICQKRDIIHKSAQLKESSPTQMNINKFINAQEYLVNSYDLEQQNYINKKIYEIQNAATNKKSALAWETINEISGRKKSNKSKLKANNDNERIQLWHKHFKDLLGKNIQSTIHSKNSDHTLKNLDIKIGHFTKEEVIKATNNISYGKAIGLDEIPAEVWKLDDFKEFLLESCNRVYFQEPIVSWTNGCILPFPKKGDPSITKNYRGISLTEIAAKIYNLMLLNRIIPEIDPILRKNQNGFRTNRSTTGQILTIIRILEGVKSKNLPLTLLFIDFSKAFDTINRKKMKEILLKYGIPE